jgi:hypothetical protein
LNVLVEAAIEREELVMKKSTPVVNKTIPAKEKHVAVIEGRSPATRRSDRLMK